MNKEETKQITETQEKAMELFSEIMELQRTIARNQIDILSKLRRIHSLGFMRMQDDLAVKHIAKFEPGRCSKCGVLVEGAYEYLRSPINKTLCVGCDGSKKIKEPEPGPYKSSRQV